MQRYKLDPNEVLFMEYEVDVKSVKGKSTVALTNLNIVVETTTKKLFEKKHVSLEYFDLGTVKIYNDTPQIKQKGCEVELYFTNAERYLTFQTKSEAHKFTAKAWELITGKNAFLRGIDKAKKAVETVDDALGIDTIGIASTVVKTAVAAKSPSGKFQKTKAIIKATTNGIIQKTETKKITENSSADDNIETLKKLKALLDDGVITQAEFDLKKKELLNL